MAGSKWAKGQDGLLLLKSAIKTKESNWAKTSQLGPGSSWAGPFWLRVKLGQGVNMGRNIYVFNKLKKTVKLMTWQTSYTFEAKLYNPASDAMSAWTKICELKSTKSLLKPVFFKKSNKYDAKL